MFQLEYKSKAGSIKFGNSIGAIGNILSMSGFEFPPRSFETINFAGENGSTVIGQSDSARTLTISGTLRGSQTDMERACRILYQEGELWCLFGQQRRKIKCRCKNMDDFERIGRSGNNKFTLQLVADYPYFNDFYDTELPLYRQRNLVTETFTLPCVFTERISEGDINNMGDKIIYPTIYITDNSSVSASSGGVLIVNETTGAMIELPDYVMTYGETITIDLGRRKITSSIAGDITNSLGDSTPDLSKFFLEVGINHLTFTNETGQVLTARIRYNPEYFTAVR